jgi:dienelactone hydrolase
MLSRRDFALASAALLAAPPPSSLGAAEVPAKDARLTAPPKTLNGHFPFTPPKTLAEWTARRTLLREQIAVALGLWPEPVKTPLNAVIRDRKIERDGYTVEMVYFESVPGHFVTGNLYRPVGTGAAKHAGVLFAHGHWANGRLHEAGEAEARASVKRGQESDIERGRFFMQALPTTLARLGFVVFQYDMVGYAESSKILHVLRSGVAHPDGFADVAGELRLQSLTGLQTWNSVRSLDFLAGLPDVDPNRLGMTGASGGATQTLLLAALDDRLKAVFPAVMVSTGMQGGCVCENASHLRRGTGNVEIAGLIAPKPLAISGADDWTRDIETTSVPPLKELYKLTKSPDNVAGKAWPKLPHNYGQPSREMMYGWFREHLQNTPGAVTEKPFVPIPVAELKVFPPGTPRPAGELGAKALRAEMAKASDTQLAAMPADERKRVVDVALRAILGTEMPAVGGVTAVEVAKASKAGRLSLTLGRAGTGDAVPAVLLTPDKYDARRAALWLHPDGVKSLAPDGRPVPAVASLLAAGVAVLAIDAFGTGSQVPATSRKVDPNYAGFTFGYNRALVAERVHDILTAAGYLRDSAKAGAVYLAGFGALGPVALLAAAAVPGGTFAKVAADADRFRFDAITSMDDPMMLPGAVKYGGLPGLTAAVPMTNVYNAAGTGLKGASDTALSPAEVVTLLLGD